MNHIELSITNITFSLYRKIPLMWNLRIKNDTRLLKFQVNFRNSLVDSWS